MTGASRFGGWAAAIAALILCVLGVVYLTVACQSLPAALGPTPGDHSPRTGLGVACLALGALVLLVSLVLRRSGRRPPPA